MSHLLSTFFYVGYLRPAPGTWGSLVALIIAYIIAYWSFGAVYCHRSSLCHWMGCHHYSNFKTETHDPSEIVIDEVVGQWVAVLHLQSGHWTLVCRFFIGL